MQVLVKEPYFVEWAPWWSSAILSFRIFGIPVGKTLYSSLHLCNAHIQMQQQMSGSSLVVLVCAPVITFTTTGSGFCLEQIIMYSRILIPNDIRNWGFHKVGVLILHWCGIKNGKYKIFFFFPKWKINSILKGLPH